MKNTLRLSILAIAAIIPCLISVTSCEEVCGAQAWFHGWDPKVNMVYQVMDSSTDHDRIAIGAKITGVDIRIAILLYSMEVQDLHDSIFIENWEVDRSYVSFYGVRSIAIQQHQKERVLAVLETDADDIGLYFLSWNRDSLYEGVHLVQVMYRQDFDITLTDHLIKFRHEDQIWLQANSVDNMNSDRKVFSLKLDLDERDFYTWDYSVFNTVVNDHELRDFILTDGYMFRVTEGTCNLGESIGPGIMVSIISTDFYLDPITLQRAFCVGQDIFNDLDYSNSNANVLPQSTTQDILANDAGQLIISLKEENVTDAPNAGFLTIARSNIWSDPTFNVFTLTRFQLEDQDRFITAIQVTNRVSHGSLDKVDILIREITSGGKRVTRILLDVNLFQAIGAEDLKEYRVSSLNQGNAQKSQFYWLDIQIGNDMQSLAIMREDSFMKFPINYAYSQENDCLQVALLTSNMITISDSIISSFKEQLGTENHEHAIDSWPTTQFFDIVDDLRIELDPQFFYKNPCRMKPMSLFKDMVFPLLTRDPVTLPLDMSDLNFGTCPDMTTITGEDYFDVRLEMIKVTQESTGNAISNFETEFFEMDSENNLIYLTSDKMSNWPAGNYTFGFKSGLYDENEFETLMRSTETITITLDADCAISVPSLFTSSNIEGDSNRFEYGVGQQDDMQLEFNGQEIQVASLCELSRTMVNQDGSPLGGPFIFTEAANQQNGRDTLTVSTIDQSDVGLYQLKYVVQSLPYPDQFTELPFEVEIIIPGSNCIKRWRFPQYSFDTIYVKGSDEQAILFDEVDITNCPFTLTVLNITDSDIKPLDTRIAILKEPVLETDDTDVTLVSVSDYARLIVQTDEEWAIGDHQLRIAVTTVPLDLQFEEEESRFLDFTLQIVPCINVPAPTDTFVEPIEYVLDKEPQEPLVLPTVQRLYKNCTNSSFIIVPEESQLPESFTVEKDEELHQVKISIGSASISTAESGNGSLDQEQENSSQDQHSQSQQDQVQQLSEGTYIVEVWEIDDYTKQVAKTIFTIEAVLSPETEKDGSKDEEEETSQTEDENSSQGRDNEETGQDNSDGSSAPDDEQDKVVEEPEIVFQDGKYVYPWQLKWIQKDERREKQKLDIKVITPLTAKIQDISPTGRLRVKFNKPIIIPKIRTVKQFEPMTRALVSESEQELYSMENDDNGEDEFYFYDIGKVLEMKVDSYFYTEDMREIQIRDYKLTQITEREMDIQIDFNIPSKITQSVAEPDLLIVKFTQPLIFMDAEDYTQLEENSEISMSIQPQHTQAEIEEIQQMGEDVASSLAGITVGVLVLQCFLYLGIKYLWNFMNLLQFLIFMQMWLISLPPRARTFLRELQNLALLEFLPYHWLIEQEDEEQVAGQEETGIDRLGSNTLIDGFGAILMIVVLIWALLVLLLLFRALAGCIPKVMKLYLYLKKTMLYNALIRFVLQSTLKLQITACTVIAYDRLTTKEVFEPTKNLQIWLASAILGALNIAPFIFLFIMIANRDNLEKIEVKDKIGTLYNGLKEKHPKVMIYSFVFLLRRSIFIAITFVLFETPGLQLLLMLKLTLVYLIYLGYASFFKQFGSKALEIVNESVFVLIQYQFILLHNLVEQDAARKAIGSVIIYLTSFLLVVNLIIIIVASLRPQVRKLYLKCIRRKNIQRHRAVTKAKLQSLSMGSIAQKRLRKIHDEQTTLNQETQQALKINYSGKEDKTKMNNIGLKLQLETNNFKPETSGMHFQPDSEQSSFKYSSDENELESIGDEDLKIKLDRQIVHRQSKTTAPGMTPMSFTNSNLNIPISNKHSSGLRKDEIDGQDELINLDSHRGLIEIKNFYDRRFQDSPYVINENCDAKSDKLFAQQLEFISSAAIPPVVLQMNQHKSQLSVQPRLKNRFPVAQNISNSVIHQRPCKDTDYLNNYDDYRSKLGSTQYDNSFSKTIELTKILRSATTRKVERGRSQLLYGKQLMIVPEHASPNPYLAYQGSQAKRYDKHRNSSLQNIQLAPRKSFIGLSKN